jgi:hypothetical protein
MVSVISRILKPFPPARITTGTSLVSIKIWMAPHEIRCRLGSLMGVRTDWCCYPRRIFRSSDDPAQRNNRRSLECLSTLEEVEDQHMVADLSPHMPTTFPTAWKVRSFTYWTKPPSNCSAPYRRRDAPNPMSRRRQDTNPPRQSRPRSRRDGRSDFIGTAQPSKSHTCVKHTIRGRTCPRLDASRS